MIAIASPRPSLRRALTAACLPLCLTLGACDSGKPTTPDPAYNEHEWIETTRQISGVRGVVLAMSGTLAIDQQGRDEIRLFGDRSLLPAVITEVRNGILEIRLEPGFLPHPNRPTEFRLSTSRLESAEVAEYGFITAPGIVAERLSLRLSGNGELDFPDLEASHLEVVTARGTGAVRVSGRVATQRVELCGVAGYEAAHLASSGARIDLSGSGSATVRVADRLSVVLSGSGSVFYFGDPEVDSTVTGTGRVVPLGG